MSVKRRDDKPAPGTVRDVCAVIRMGVNDTAIAYALDTCLKAAFHTVYIVDANRGKAEYESQQLIGQLRAKGIKVVFLTSDIGLYSHMAGDNMVMEVPPDCYALREQTLALIAHARVRWRQTKYRRFAMAPTYEQAPSFANGFLLLLHLFWSLMGLFVMRRMYRATFMTLTVLRREADIVSVPEEQSFNRDKEPFIFGSKGCRSKAPPDRAGLDHFMYLVDRETFSLRIIVLLLAYCFFLMIPFWFIGWSSVVANPFTFGWPHLMGLVSSVRDIFSTGRLVWWIVHGLIAAYYTRAYFDSLNYIYAFLLPFYAILFPVFIFWAKFVWRGYAGDAPILKMPSMLPRTVPGAVFLPLQSTDAAAAAAAEPKQKEEEDGDNGGYGNNNNNNNQEDDSDENGSGHDDDTNVELIARAPLKQSVAAKKRSAAPNPLSSSSSSVNIGEEADEEEPPRPAASARSPKRAPRSVSKVAVPSSWRG